MIYAKPLYRISEVNRAGRIVSESESFDECHVEKDIVDNWRAAHQYPLNSFTMTLKGRAASVSPRALVAQRIKRLASIQSKLVAHPEMKLSQMQDIGGCRTVLPDLSDLRELVGMYFVRKITHPFIGMKDYIDKPQGTGYRGVHLKYRYAGRGQNVAWEGLKIEIQIRTMLQHRWATAVEAAGTFTNAALKSNKGSAEWLRFFALFSSIFALKEGTGCVPGTPGTFKALRAEIRELDGVSHIAQTFMRYSALIPTIERGNKAHYYLVTLNPLEQVVRVEGFKKEEFAVANAKYSEAERRLPRGSKTQVVLVSVSSINALKRAYPNYFLDTQGFLREVLAVLSYD